MSFNGDDPSDPLKVANQLVNETRNELLNQLAATAASMGPVAWSNCDGVIYRRDLNVKACKLYATIATPSK